MRRGWLSLVTGLVVLHGSAQSPLLPQDLRVDLNPGYRNVLSLHGTVDYNANTVANELPLAIYRGGFLDRSLRQRTSDKLKASGNTAGYLIEGSLQWTGAACLGKWHRWRPLVQVAYHDLSGASFTKDQYDLAFFGNAMFEERTAALSPSRYERVRYQTIGFGLMYDSTGSQLRIDLVRGQSFTALDVRSADLFTGADGRVLRTSITGDYFASDTAGGGLDHTNGLGAALSGRWTFPGDAQRPFRFTIGVEDLGFIAWDPNSVRISKDTLISYEGWRVENLIALEGVLINEEAALDTFGLRYRHGSVLRPTPFRAYVEATFRMSTNWRLGLAVDHRYLTGYVPQATLQASHVLGTRTMLGASVSYGGFGGFRMGIAAKHRFGRHVLVSLSTPQLPGFFDGRVSGLGVLVGTSIGF